MMQSLKNRLSISGSSLIFLALLLLVLPFRWILAALLAAALHELGHYIAIRLCGGQVRDLTILQSGAALQTGEMSREKELFCTIAGPLCGSLLIPLVRFAPRLAICASIQTLYNLLPIYPLDGGRALRCVTAMWLSPNIAKKLCAWAENIFLAGIAVIGLYATFGIHLGILPLLLCAVLIGKVVNTTCKE